MAQTTKKDFKTYKDYCNRYINLFGLLHWEVHYTHDAIDEDIKSCCIFDMEAKNVNIFLNKNWPSHCMINEQELEHAALHESLEILIYPMRYLAGQRTLLPTQIGTTVHDIIQTLINVFRKEGMLC